MWIGAFSSAYGVSLAEIISLALAAVALVLSVLAVAKEMGPQYELKGNRAGLAFIALGILLYVAGTSMASALLHCVAIVGFYSGSALYLGGPRAVLPTVPCGLIIMSLLAPPAYGFWGTLYLDGLSWALVVVSAGILWVRRTTTPSPRECYLCGFFRVSGRSFCSSCGSLLAPPLGSLPRRRVLGFAVFALVMVAALSLTVPLVTATPTVSLVNYGLGGPSSARQFAPLPGWGAAMLLPTEGYSGVSGYALKNGAVGIQAFIAESPYPGSALSAVNSTMTKPSPYPKVPAIIAQSMAGYTFTSGGTKYFGVQGVFPMGFLNVSVNSYYVAVGLRESAESFARDNGSAFFSAASTVVNWISGWKSWSSAVGAFQALYQAFTQLANVSSISAFGVILFTIAREDELRKVRRIESLRGLGSPETLILRTLATSPGPLLGDQLLYYSRQSDPSVTASYFYESLDELVRRDLVSPSFAVRTGTRPVLWKCLV